MYSAEEYRDLLRAEIDHYHPDTCEVSVACGQRAGVSSTFSFSMWHSGAKESWGAGDKCDAGLTCST